MSIKRLFCESFLFSGIIKKLGELCKKSMLLSGDGVLQDLYESSMTRKLWDKFSSADDPAESSIYRAPFRLLERVLNRSLSWPVDKLMLLLFALYLPIGYIIRNYLGIALLSSVWEELFICAGIAVIYAKGRFDRVSSVEVFLLLYIGACLLLCLINRPYPSVAFAGFRAQVEYVVWFFIVIRLIDSKKTARWMVWLFAGVVFVMCLHGIYQYIIGVEVPTSWTSQTETAVRTRVFSITGSPNIFGDIIVMAAPSVAALIYYCKKPIEKIIAFGCTFLMCLCILFTFSKGAWVGLIVAIIIFAMYCDKRIILAMGTAMAAVLAVFPTIVSRITYLFTNDYAEASLRGGRAMRWELGRNLLAEGNKWLGYGLGRYGGAVAMNNQLLDETEEFAYYYLDNYYMKTMVEAGYIGLIVFILVLLVLAIFGIRSCHRSGIGFKADRSIDPIFRNAGNDKLICVGIFSGLMGVLVHCYFENIFEEPYMMAYFWGLAAVLIWYGYHAGKDS